MQTVSCPSMPLKSRLAQRPPRHKATVKKESQEAVHSAGQKARLISGGLAFVPVRYLAQWPPRPVVSFVAHWVGPSEKWEAMGG